MKYLLQVAFYLLIIFSILFIIIGLKFSESAVQEASAAAFACYFGIMARLVQADLHKSND
jgi:hypothetical protein